MVECVNQHRNPFGNCQPLSTTYTQLLTPFFLRLCVAGISFAVVGKAFYSTVEEFNESMRPGGSWGGSLETNDQFYTIDPDELVKTGLVSLALYCMNVTVILTVCYVAFRFSGVKLPDAMEGTKRAGGGKKDGNMTDGRKDGWAADSTGADRADESAVRGRRFPRASQHFSPGLELTNDERCGVRLVSVLTDLSAEVDKPGHAVANHEGRPAAKVSFAGLPAPTTNRAGRKSRAPANLQLGSMIGLAAIAASDRHGIHDNDDGDGESESIPMVAVSEPESETAVHGSHAGGGERESDLMLDRDMPDSEPEFVSLSRIAGRGGQTSFGQGASERLGAASTPPPPTPDTPPADGGALEGILDRFKRIF